MCLTDGGMYGQSGLAFPDAKFPVPDICYIYLEWND